MAQSPYLVQSSSQVPRLDMAITPHTFASGAAGCGGGGGGGEGEGGCGGDGGGAGEGGSGFETAP